MPPPLSFSGVAVSDGAGFGEGAGVVGAALSATTPCAPPPRGAAFGFGHSEWRLIRRRGRRLYPAERARLAPALGGAAGPFRAHIRAGRALMK